MTPDVFSDGQARGTKMNELGILKCCSRQCKITKVDCSSIKKSTVGLSGRGMLTEGSTTTLNHCRRISIPDFGLFLCNHEDRKAANGRKTVSKVRCCRVVRLAAIWGTDHGMAASVLSGDGVESILRAFVPG